MPPTVLPEKTPVFPSPNEGLPAERQASLAAHAAARDVAEDDAARSAARAAGQAMATAHVPSHAIAAAIYAATAVRDAATTNAAAATEQEREWQYRHLLALSKKVFV